MNAPTATGSAAGRPVSLRSDRESSGARVAPSPLLPFALLLLYVALVYLRPFEYRQYAPLVQGIPVLPIVMGLMLLAWLPVAGKRFDAPHYPLILGLMLCVPISIASGVRWFGGAYQAFVDFVPVVVLFVVTATLSNAPQRLRQLFALLAVVSTIIAWHGVEQAANGIGWSGVELIHERIRYVGFLHDPNDLAMALLMTIPMALSFVRRDGSKILGLLALASAGAMLYGIYLTNSRGAIVALASMLAVYSLLRYGWRRSLLMLPVLLAALVIAAPDRIDEISADEASASGRIEAWYEGVQMIKSHPLLGVGRGQFLEHHFRTAHNSFVLAAAELGLVGYFFWFSLIAVSVMMLAALLRGPAPPISATPASRSKTRPGDPDASWAEHQRLARILAYSLTGCLAAAFFLSRSYTLLLYLPLALVVGLYQSARARWPHLPAFSLRSQFRNLLLLEAGSLVFLWLATRVLLAFN